MAIQIQVKEAHSFEGLEKRLNFARFVANIFCAGTAPRTLPYPTTPHEQYEFIVDQYNNWFLVFDKENPLCVKLIRPRDNNPALVEAASRFIAHLYGESELVEVANDK